MIPIIIESWSILGYVREPEWWQQTPCGEQPALRSHRLETSNRLGCTGETPGQAQRSPVSSRA